MSAIEAGRDNNRGRSGRRLATGRVGAIVAADAGSGRSGSRLIFAKIDRRDAQRPRPGRGFRSRLCRCVGRRIADIITINSVIRQTPGERVRRRRRVMWTGGGGRRFRRDDRHSV